MTIPDTAKPLPQRGASIFTILVLAAMVGMILLTALKLAPAYLDNNVVSNAIKGVLANNNVSEMSIGQVRTEAMKTINVNRVEGFDSGAIVFAEEGSYEYIDVNYETRVSLFYNIDAVVKFENRFDR